ncbi:MAG: cupin domain-containing protein [Planctomycetia bacterium]|nr:cupin domain-containing protein [Planctomycetia bacterium]
MSTTDNQRLRPHPDDRFGNSATLVNLRAVAAALRSERNTGEGGHRQETVFKQGHLTVALFVFDRFSHLPEHVAEGIVTMHVLKGWMKISVGDVEHTLKAGQILIVNSGIRHALKAEEESEVLVGVYLDS